MKTWPPYAAFTTGCGTASIVVDEKKARILTQFIFSGGYLNTTHFEKMHCSPATELISPPFSS
jgi:hypothetical protein